MKQLAALFGVLLAIALAGAPDRWATAAGETAPRPDARPLVWVVDGAGDMHGCSNSLKETNRLLDHPVEILVVPWSHGYRRIYLDQVDEEHAKAAGARLAQQVGERARREPGRRTVIVAHSAGSGVALAAAKCLPRDAIHRIILLSPSVSARYDLAPCLPATREGIDVFCSKKDWLVLGVATRLFGMSDRRWAPASGRVGFRRVCDCSKVRQYSWTKQLAWTGNDGGHSGTQASIFSQVYVFPLLVGTER